MASKHDNKFLDKLYKILGDGAFSDVIAWTSNWQGFEIKDQFEFTAEVLPKFFKHSNLSSFIRQLNIYGFRKVKKSNKAIEFRHDVFGKTWQKESNVIPRRTTEVKMNENRVKKGKEKVQKMVKTIGKLKNRQGKLEDHIQNQEAKIKDIRNFNDSLELEIYRSKEREREVTALLSILGSYLKSAPNPSWRMYNAYNRMLKDLDIPIPTDSMSEPNILSLTDTDGDYPLMLPLPQPDDFD